MARKSTRRQVASDSEEEATGHEGDTQETERGSGTTSSRRRPTTGASKRKNTSARSERDAAGDSQEADAYDDSERIDVENFTDQPLRQNDHSKIQSIGKDWNQMEKQVRPKWRVVGDVAVALADAGEGDEAEKGLRELDKIMRNIIDISEEMLAHEKTLDNIAQSIARGQDIDNAIELYEEGVKGIMVEYSSRTSRQKYAKSKEYTSYKHNIYEVQHPGKAPPPIGEFIPKENGDESDDEDLEIGGAIQSYTCPITLTPLVDPVTSSVCGHSFSQDAIFSTFNHNPNAEVKCPTSGCTKRFYKRDLQPDKDLAKRVKAWQRRNEQQREEQEAEEIID